MKKKFLFAFMMMLVMLVFCVISVSASHTSGSYRYTYSSPYDTVSRTVEIIDYWGSDEELVIPDILGGEPVGSIGKGAFDYSKFTSVTIPASISNIGDYAFENCTELTSVKISTIGNSVSIGVGAFSNCSNLTNITIPDRVTSMGGNVFSGCSSLNSVKIGNGVTSIGGGTFSGCSSLTSITIPDGIKSIGNYAFEDCSNLTSITIPDGVTSIGKYAFEKCTGLTSVTIGNGVTSIGEYAFEKCTGLTSITIPDSVTSIGSCAFKNCTGLTSVTIGNGVTSIRYNAFSGCTGLVSIAVDKENLYYTSEDGVLFNKDMSKLIRYPIGKSAMKYSIPDTVTIIGAEAFFDCNTLTSITIPDGVTSIEQYAFYGCTRLTSVTIPDSIKSIREYAFQKCTGLTSVTIGNGVTSIGSKAFYNCTGLKKAYYNSSESNWNSITIGSNNEALLEAKYCFYYVTFVDNEDNEITIMNSADERPDLSGLTHRTGYTIKLYTDKECTAEFNRYSAVTENITLYYKYIINRYTYKFVDEDGTILKKETIDYGTVIIAPNIDDKTDYYLFDHWDNYVENMTIAYNITFTAVYKYKDYLITAEGLAEPVVATYNSSFRIEPQKMDDYHYFIGYFTEKGGKGTKITNKYGESIKPYNVVGNLTLYPYFYEGYMNKIELRGTNSAMPGDVIVQKAIFATDKEAMYLVAMVKYPKFLNFKSITGVNFIEVSREPEKKVGEYKYLNITCVYDYKGGFVPMNKDLVPFEIKFDVAADAPIGSTQIELENVLLSGDVAYNISDITNNTLEIAPKLAENIELVGEETIDKATQFTAVVSPDYTTDKSIGWTVSDETVASVSDDGIVTPIKNGRITLTAMAKDGSAVFKTKVINVIAYAKITGISVSGGQILTEFNPDTRKYVVYVKDENATSITLSPTFSGGGVLRANGSGVWISGDSKEFTLNEDSSTIITLNRENVPNMTNSIYTVEVIKFNGAKTSVSEDGKIFVVNPINIGVGKTVILALYNNGKLAEMKKTISRENEIIYFETNVDYTEAKVLVWDDFNSLKSVCGVEIVK